MRYVAVVMSPSRPSRRPKGDWSAFTGNSKRQVVAKALDAARSWGVGYEVWVGRLTHRVEVPTSYTLVALEVIK